MEMNAGQPSEFGKKTDSKKMSSYMKIMTAKHKLRRQKYAVMYYAYESKIWLAYFTKYVCVEMVMKQKVHTFYINKYSRHVLQNITVTSPNSLHS